MQRALRRTAPGLLLLVAGVGQSTESEQVWQADIQIRTLEVTKTKTTMSARVVIYTENDDAARDARLLIHR